MKNKKLFFFDLVSITILFSLDRLSKILILHEYQIDRNFNIEITKFLNFNLVWNEGIAFGLLANNNDIIYNLITFIIIIIILILFYLSLIEKTKKRYFFILICSGGLGNLYDRLSFGAVIDFIDIHFKNFHWFIFNVADIMVTIGVSSLILIEFFLSKNVSRNK